MTDLLKLILGLLASLFKSRANLEAEVLILRQQINVLRRRMPKWANLNNTDRFLFVWLYRLFPSVLGAVAIIRPETIIRWHRAGFRAYWRWRSRNGVGRPGISGELRALIGEMSRANALWGAPRIHGELLKLGFDVAQSTVARYMCRRWRPPSQGWRTFLTNHADGIAAVDLFALPTIAFQTLYCLVIVRHGRRLWFSFGMTANPTAEWISRQITDAFPWDDAPRYLIRDRDTSYGPVFVRRLRAMGIRDRPTAPRSPWQNTYVERLIGSIECLDHMIVLGEAHLHRILGAYAAYYNESRTHRSLKKDTPVHRATHAGRLSFHLGPLTLCSLFVPMAPVRSPATRCRRMSNVTYYVAIGFELIDGELVAMDPAECQSSTQAISRARSLAAKKAGAVAFSRTGDPNIGEFSDAVVLFSAGDVPDEIPAG